MVLALTILPSSSSATGVFDGHRRHADVFAFPGQTRASRRPPSLSTRPQNRRTVSVVAPGLVRNVAMGTRIGDDATRLLQRLASRQLLGSLSRLDDARRRTP